MESHYHTIQKSAVAEFKDRGSRFLAYTYEIDRVEDFKPFILNLKKEHPKANHHCFAYRIGFDGNVFRVSDDGEPSGSAGRPILGQIDSRELINTLVIVVRYFGGTLLGVPGLIHAYKSAASLALEQSGRIIKPILVNRTISFDYTQMNDVMRITRQYECVILKQEAGLFCTMEIGIPINQLVQTETRLNDLQGIEVRNS